MVFSPSSMQRLAHTLIGAYILAAFFVMSIAAYYIFKGRHLDFAEEEFHHRAWSWRLWRRWPRRSSGDLQGEKSRKHNPPSSPPWKRSFIPARNRRRCISSAGPTQRATGQYMASPSRVC